MHQISNQGIIWIIYKDKFLETSTSKMHLFNCFESTNYKCIAVRVPVLSFLLWRKSLLCPKLIWLTNKRKKMAYLLSQDICVLINLWRHPSSLKAISSLCLRVLCSIALNLLLNRKFREVHLLQHFISKTTYSTVPLLHAIFFFCLQHLIQKDRGNFGLLHQLL